MILAWTVVFVSPYLLECDSSGLCLCLEPCVGHVFGVTPMSLFGRLPAFCLCPPFSLSTCPSFCIDWWSI